MPRRVSSIAAKAADRAIPWEMAEGLGTIRKRTRKGETSWYIDLRPVGRVWSNRGIAFTRRKDAERILNEIRGKVANQPLRQILSEYLPLDSRPNQIKTRLAEWIKTKEAEVRAGNLSPGYAATLRRHNKPKNLYSFWDGCSIHEIRYAKLDDWVKWLGTERKLAPTSQRTALREFRSFITWLHRREEIPSVPPMPTVKVPTKDPKVLTRAQQMKVLAAIPVEKRGAFLAMATLGVRPNEARAARVSDLEPDQHGRVWLVIRRSALTTAANSGTKPGTKNGKEKRVPVSAELSEWIADQVDPRARLQASLLFPNPATGRMWGHEPLRKAWRKACEAVEVDVTMYSGCKHTLGADLKRQGADDAILQKLFGHASMSSVRFYARIADESLVGLVDLGSRRQTKKKRRSKR